MKCPSSKWLLLPFLLVWASSNGAAQAQNSAASDRDALRQLVQRPKGLADLLSNLKAALEAGLLRRDSFYSEDVLSHFFAARKVQFFRSALNKIRGKIEDFDPIVPTYRGYGGKDYDGMSLHFDKSTQPDQFGCFATMQVYVQVNTATHLEQIVTVFGPGWERSSEPTIVLDGPPRNPPITYSVANGKVKWFASFDFKNDVLEKAAFCAQ